MISQTFSTDALPVLEQLGAWRRWLSPVFEVDSLRPTRAGFLATNWNWSLAGLMVSRVCSPPALVWRPASVIRRSPVDHWAITFSKHSPNEVQVRDTSLSAPPGAPFVLSLGEEMRISRALHDDRLQLLLSRDHFGAIAHHLEAVKGILLEGAQANLLADYMLVLERHLPSLAPEDVARLPMAVEAMLAACLGPSADRAATAQRQIDFTLMERVRRVVRHNLKSSTLGPDKLCREAAMSRSQLYRVLESEGGVAHYIQRRRLSESFALLCDASQNLQIGKVAEMLCFADASSFSRAFRQEFGVTPREVRVASLAGQSPPPPKAAASPRFAESLRGF
ncbi:MAG: helix-turn-helix transcriptional regulator [Alphaproteobacteria bacterium]|nr:helix-turn-helix transcriptional regulator [Alphaproteobacteria bacterium]MBV8408042.1 helix-turn-helix transcriptional regulator [Alphaproteobacteria bacterium]